jgi:hypothetical protein
VSYGVVPSFEAVEDVLRITVACKSKTAMTDASKRLRTALQNDPADAGDHLSEGLYYIDREPLRAFFTIDVDEMTVEIVSVGQV